MYRTEFAPHVLARNGQPVVITKHGRPVAQLVPVAAKPAELKSLFGYMKNTVTLKGDTVAPTDDFCSAVSGEKDRFLAGAGKICCWV